MIIKSLSNKGHVGTLLRYVFRATGTQTKAVVDYSNHVDRIIWDKKLGYADFVVGIRLTEKDIKYLQAERVSARLTKELKRFEGTTKEFIERYLTTTNKSGLLKRDKEEKGKETVTFILKHNLKSSTISGMEKEFKENEKHRIYKSSRQNTAIHTILSWGGKDKGITDMMLKDIATKYVQLRGDSNLYCVTKHADKDSVHLHIVMSATQINGKSSRISKHDFAKLKLDMDLFQKTMFPQLTSLPEHGKGRKFYKIDERSSDKKFVKELLETTLVKSSSSNDFFSALNNLGHQVYYRNGKAQGIKYKGGNKYRFSRMGLTPETLKKLDETQNKINSDLKDLRQLRDRNSDRISDRFKTDLKESADIEDNAVVENTTKDSKSDEPSKDSKEQAERNEQKDSEIEQNDFER